MVWVSANDQSFTSKIGIKQVASWLLRIVGSGYPLVETSNRDMEAKDGEGWGERKTSDCEECLATSMVQVWYLHVVYAESAVWMC